MYAVELAKTEWLQSQLVASRKDMKLHTFFSPPSQHTSIHREPQARAPSPVPHFCVPCSDLLGIRGLTGVVAFCASG